MQPHPLFGRQGLMILSSLSAIAASPIGREPAKPATTAPTQAEAAGFTELLAARADASALEPAATGPAATDGAAAAAATDGAGRFVHQSSRSGEMEPLQRFESFFLRSFIEEMLPKEDSAIFGTGSAGKIWKSMLAERIGDEMAAAGGIGIADMLAEHGPGRTGAAKTK